MSLLETQIFTQKINFQSLKSDRNDKFTHFKPLKLAKINFGSRNSVKVKFLQIVGPKLKIAGFEISKLSNFQIWPIVKVAFLPNLDKQKHVFL